jgi:hypothetical protein
MTQATEEQRRTWPWLPLAQVGELQMALHTRRHAVELDLSRRDVAQYVGIIEPDYGEPIAISFVSAASVRLFISEMKPRDVRIFVAEGEDLQAITDVLLRDFDAPLH